MLGRRSGTFDELGQAEPDDLVPPVRPGRTQWTPDLSHFDNTAVGPQPTPTGHAGDAAGPAPQAERHAGDHADRRRTGRPPIQGEPARPLRHTGPSRRAFLTSRAEGIIAADFFHPDTALGRRLYAPAFLAHGTRRLHSTERHRPADAGVDGAAGEESRRRPRDTQRVPAVCAARSRRHVQRGVRRGPRGRETGRDQECTAGAWEERPRRARHRQPPPQGPRPPPRQGRGACPAGVRGLPEAPPRAPAPRRATSHRPWPATAHHDRQRRPQAAAPPDPRRLVSEYGYAAWPVATAFEWHRNPPTEPVCVQRISPTAERAACSGSVRSRVPHEPSAVRAPPSAGHWNRPSTTTVRRAMRQAPSRRVKWST